MIRTLSAFLIASLCLYGNPVYAVPLMINETKLTAGDATARDQFGNSVAVSGDTVVVGATFGDSDTVFSSGAAYVFVQAPDGTWTEQQKLTASDPVSLDLFGISVAISEDTNTIVVGAAQLQVSGGAPGKAFVFVREADDTWSEQAKLTASDAAVEDVFGASVALSGDTIIVGASGNDDAGNDSGSAYVFVRTGTTWSEQQKLTASDPSNREEFGGSVALSGDTAVVGAGLNDATGGAYVFERSETTWTEEQILTASDADSSDLFGRAVAFNGDTIVVGASGNDDAGDDSGSAYVFVKAPDDTWAEKAKLIASDAVGRDFFGQSVAVSGDMIVVGAHLDDDAGENSGSVYVFVRSGSSWVQQGKLNASDAAGRDFFGQSVAVNGDTVVVGATGDDDGGEGSGSAYVLKVVPNFFQATLSGTRFCSDLSGTGTKEKFKDKAELTLNLSALPLVTANVQLEHFLNPFTLSGMALLQNPKSGVFQLFGPTGGGTETELALSGTIKLNKKTGVWSSLKGKFQLLERRGQCTLAGKFKAK